MQSLSQYHRLYKDIGYEFQQENGITLALTHRSAAKDHNERLEFLGDAVLGLVIGEALFKQFPKEPEGNLTRMRSSLVKGETLAALGRQFNLGEYLILGPGEMKSGGHRRDSILADAVEAIIGAIYLEEGIEKTQSVVLSWFATRLSELNPATHSKDNKTRLQEYLQGRGEPLPQYQVLDVSGKDHNQTFEVECLVETLNLRTQASASSRRKAEQQAAAKVLEQIANDA